MAAGVSAAPIRRGFSARDGLQLSALDWPGPAWATPLLCLSGIARSSLEVPTSIRGTTAGAAAQR